MKQDEFGKRETLDAHERSDRRIGEQLNVYNICGAFGHNARNRFVEFSRRPPRLFLYICLSFFPNPAYVDQEGQTPGGRRVGPELRHLLPAFGWLEGSAGGT